VRRSNRVGHLGPPTLRPGRRPRTRKRSPALRSHTCAGCKPAKRPWRAEHTPMQRLAARYRRPCEANPKQRAQIAFPALSTTPPREGRLHGDEVAASILKLIVAGGGHHARAPHGPCAPGLVLAGRALLPTRIATTCFALPAAPVSVALAPSPLTQLLGASRQRPRLPAAFAQLRRRLPR